MSVFPGYKHTQTTSSKRTRIPKEKWPKYRNIKEWTIKTFEYLKKKIPDQWK